MPLEQLIDYLPLSPITEVSVGGLCSSTGQWYYEVSGTTSATGDFNSDSAPDVQFSNNDVTFPAMSAQFAANVVPGESYTLSFDVVGTANVAALSYEVRNCVGGMYVNTASTAAGHYSETFTVPANAPNKVRIKWLAIESTNANMSFTISNIALEGPGDAFGTGTSAPTSYEIANQVGDKRFELANHLGNVLNVVTDRKLPASTNNSTVAFFKPDVVSYSDYYAFGMSLPYRNASVSEYRYSFQGQEKDDEIKGAGNSLNYEYRMHDPRIGRFFAVDPLAAKYPFNSPYAFSENRVIDGVEFEGLEYVCLSAAARVCAGNASFTAFSGIGVGIDGLIAFSGMGAGTQSAGLHGAIGLGVSYFHGTSSEMSGNGMEWGVSANLGEGGELSISQSGDRIGFGKGMNKMLGARVSIGLGAELFENYTYTYVEHISWEEVADWIDKNVGKDMPANFIGNNVSDEATAKKYLLGIVMEGENQIREKVESNKSAYESLKQDYDKYKSWYESATLPENKSGNAKKMRELKDKMLDIKKENNILRRSLKNIVQIKSKIEKDQQE